MAGSRNVREPAAGACRGLRTATRAVVVSCGGGCDFRMARVAPAPEGAVLSPSASATHSVTNHELLSTAPPPHRRSKAPTSLASLRSARHRETRVAQQDTVTCQRLAAPDPSSRELGNQSPVTTRGPRHARWWCVAVSEWLVWHLLPKERCFRRLLLRRNRLQITRHCRPPRMLFGRASEREV